MFDVAFDFPFLAMAQNNSEAIVAYNDQLGVACNEKGHYLEDVITIEQFNDQYPNGIMIMMSERCLWGVLKK